MDRRTFITTAVGALGAVALTTASGGAAVAAGGGSAVSASAATAAARPTLRQGSRGAAVTTLQKRLWELKYWTGTPNGRFDHTTAQAVMAFQKVNGLSADTVVGPSTWRKLDRGETPKPRSTSGRVLEVDLRRQVLLFVVDGQLRYVLNTSTGTSKTPTPTGKYKAFRQIDGWRKAPLGNLYRPKYFHRGYAVHGVKDGNIPAKPASHGCARVSMAAMDLLWTRSGVRINDTVWVY